MLMNQSVPGSDENLMEKLGRLRDDFPLYAEECLMIKPKSGPAVPFVLNKAQRYINARLDDQLARLGYVRALILKGRQQGASTLIGGRFYHKATLYSSTNVYILTHEQAATDNLFSMAQRYHKHSPLRPETGKANAKELAFPKLDGGYTVGTAGVKAGGRSKTIQLFHGSEVAFWPNDTDQFSGVVQTIPLEAGTEIILESTANGVVGEFHDRWQRAEAGIGDYIAIFVPWFWDPGYVRVPEPDFQLKTEKEGNETISEFEYAELHGLSMPQMAWRRAKIADVGITTFMQEYPATADEAFQTTGHDSYIKPASVLKARKSEHEGVGPLIVGVDPSRFGDDRFSVAWRQGRKVSKIERRSKVETVAAANWLKKIIDEDKPDKMFIDAGGGGAQIYDLLISYGEEYEEIAELVNFGDPPEEPAPLLESGEKRPGPKNRRAEMWMRSRDWLTQVGGADIPDEGVIQSDACAPGYRYDTNQRLLMESKEAMRSRGARSPDDWDSVVLTFASSVYDETVVRSAQKTHKAKVQAKSRLVKRGGTSWMAR